MSCSGDRIPRKMFVHENGEYVSIGFIDSNDTLLPMPEGDGDRERVREWAEAVNRLIEAQLPDDWKDGEDA